MKKNKRTLLSLNKTRIYNLNHLSGIIGGLATETKECETHQEGICICEETLSCRSSAFLPPTGLVIDPRANATQTNGLPGNDCC